MKILNLTLIPSWLILQWTILTFLTSSGQAQNSDEDYIDNDYGLGGLPPSSSSTTLRAISARPTSPSAPASASSSSSSGGTETRVDQSSHKLYDPKCPSSKSDFESIKHPCTRICQPGVQMRCEFVFKIDYYLTNSAACGNCTSQNIFQHCKNHKCILADGVRRLVAIVNGAMPGPSIRVCEHDTVIVDVENHLDEGTTIHWHGIHQKGTPFMDGVPGITQCAIPPRRRFRYEFTTPISGTYFWHSHALFQRGDGVYGSLIVRRPPQTDSHGPANGNLYDCDLPEHELIVMDWQEQYGRDVFSNAVYGLTPFQPRNALVNGKGFPRLHFSQNPTVPSIEEIQAWTEEILIEPKKRYRLRIISNAIVSCPFQMSIENHQMTVIASDGFDLQPEVVDSLVMYPGERWDVVIQGDQKVGAYWIKFRGLNFCRNSTDPKSSVYQVAILRYQGYDQSPDHVVSDWLQAVPPAGYRQINSFNTYSEDSRHLTVAELKNLHVDDDDPEIITGRADHQFFLPFDFNRVDNISITGPHTPASLANIRGTLRSPQINHVSYVMPKIPLLTQPGPLSFKFICNNTNEIFSTSNPLDKIARFERPGDGTPTCVKKYCACTHLLKVKKDAIVELVLIDTGVPLNASHPFHLHGHSFRVTDIQKLGIRTSVPDVRKHMEKPERIMARQRSLAPIKDTVNVQDGGYTVIRFRADNPGFWFFHCHVEFHAEVGMGLVFQVGERSEMTPTPINFPTCGTDTGGPPTIGESPGRQKEEESISLYRDGYFRIFDSKVTEVSATHRHGRSFIITGKASWTIFEGSQLDGRHLCIRPRPKNGQYLLPQGWSMIGSVQKYCGQNKEPPYNTVDRRPFK